MDQTTSQLKLSDGGWQCGPGSMDFDPLELAIMNNTLLWNGYPVGRIDEHSIYVEWTDQEIDHTYQVKRLSEDTVAYEETHVKGNDGFTVKGELKKQ
ncbi:MAG: hypothetical protein HY537_10425 [Deltaproteobacteria bacterium]|nr:hypothetical protein [Deltaproteobacteria bacterium]